MLNSAPELPPVGPLAPTARLARSTWRRYLDASQLKMIDVREIRAEGDKNNNDVTAFLDAAHQDWLGDGCSEW